MCASDRRTTDISIPESAPIEVQLSQGIERLGATALAFRDERDAAHHKMRVARAHVEQVIACLIKDSHGYPREPSLNECEAREMIELLQQIHEELGS